MSNAFVTDNYVMEVTRLKDCAWITDNTEVGEP